MQPDIRIDKLRLRVPGVDSAAAKRIATAVAQRVGEYLALNGASASLARLEIRLPATQHATEFELVDEISKRLVGAIR